MRAARAGIASAQVLAYMAKSLAYPAAIAFFSGFWGDVRS
jgi:hypothetical protein